MINKTVWNVYKNRQADQRNQTEDHEINPHIYGYLFFDKETKTIQREKVSSTNDADLTGCLPVEECK